MGMLDSHAPVPDPLDGNTFWTDKDPLTSDRELRPTWNTWSANATWVPGMIEKIRADGPNYCVVDREELLAVPQQVLTSVLYTVWSSMKQKWREGQKDVDAQKARTQQKRRHARKETVRLTLAMHNVQTHVSDF